MDGPQEAAAAAVGLVRDPASRETAPLYHRSMESPEILSLIALVISVPTAVWTLAYSHRQTAAAARANVLTEKAQREQAEPYVVADIKPRIPGTSLLTFVIENIGPTVAREVQLSIHPPLRSTMGAEREVILNRAMARKIPMLPPGRSLSFVMDVSHKLFASDLPLLYTVNVDAVGPFGKMETLTYVIDLEIMRNTGLERESLEWSTHVIAEQSKKSTKALERQVEVLKALNSQVVQRIAGDPQTFLPDPPPFRPPAE